MKKQGYYVILLSILIIGSTIGVYIVYHSTENLKDLNQNLLFHDPLWEGDGNIISQERAIEGFDSIVLDGVGDVNIHPGEQYKVVIRTDSNLQDNVIIKVNGSKLHIDQKQKRFNSKEMTIDVYMPELKNVTLNGVGDVKVISGSASKLEISLIGTGSIDVKNYHVENAIVVLSGVGDITLWVTQTLKGEHTGVGDILYKGTPTIKDIDFKGVGSVTTYKQ